MRVQSQVGEDPGMHPWVQGLDPAVETLGKAGELLHLVSRATPASEMRAAVDPVDTNDTPAASSACASSSSPVLSYTEISARLDGPPAVAHERVTFLPLME